MNFKVSSISLMLVSSAIAMNAHANQGTITFDGQVVDSTCDVAVNGGSADATVVLPTVSVNTLKAASDTAGRTSFSMELSNCSNDADKVAAYFQAGATVDPNTGRLVNQATTDAATNVDLQLSEADGTVIKAGDSTQTYQTVDASTGSATLNYGVEYFATGQSTAGAVDSSVIYSLSYN